MIILAIIKASGLKTSVGSFALVWEVFWQQIEASVAVLMVSLTAFRSVFVSNSAGVRRQRSYPSSRKHLLFFWKRSRLEQIRDPSSPNLEMAAPLTLGTKFRRAQNMCLGESQSREEPKVEVLESVYTPVPRASSIHSDDGLLLPGKENSPMDTWSGNK